MLLPRSTFARFALLLSLMILSSQIAVWALYQQEVLRPAAAGLNVLLEGEYSLYQHDGFSPPMGMLTARPKTQPGHIPKAMFLRETAKDWQTHHPGAKLQVETLSNGQSRLWIRGGVDKPWLGLALPSLDFGGWSFLALRLGFVWLVTLLGALLVVQQINRPLTRLARKARAIGQGAAPEMGGSVGGPSEVMALERAMENMASDLHDLYEERQVLLTAISHELRTPLSRLAVALDLSDRQLLAEREAMLSDIDDLNNRIDRVLTVIRSGQEEPFVSGDGALLFDHLAQLAREEYSLQVTQRIMPENQLFLRYKPLALERVFRNLIDNASKYGDGHLDLDWEREDGFLQWILEDRGPGVEPELLTRLGREALSPGIAQGMGLGLRLSQRMMHWHGGSLDFARGHSGGLQVRLRLPLGLCGSAERNRKVA